MPPRPTAVNLIALRLVIFFILILVNGFGLLTA